MLDTLLLVHSLFLSLSVICQSKLKIINRMSREIFVSFLLSTFILTSFPETAIESSYQHLTWTYNNIFTNVRSKWLCHPPIDLSITNSATNTPSLRLHMRGHGSSCSKGTPRSRHPSQNTWSMWRTSLGKVGVCCWRQMALFGLLTLGITSELSKSLLSCPDGNAKLCLSQMINHWIKRKLPCCTLPSRTCFIWQSFKDIFYRHNGERVTSTHLLVLKAWQAKLGDTNWVNDAGKSC